MKESYYFRDRKKQLAELNRARALADLPPLKEMPVRDNSVVSPKIKVKQWFERQNETNKQEVYMYNPQEDRLLAGIDRKTQSPPPAQKPVSGAIVKGKILIKKAKKPLPSPAEAEKEFWSRKKIQYHLKQVVSGLNAKQSTDFLKRKIEKFNKNQIGGNLEWPKNLKALVLKEKAGASQADPAKPPKK